MSSSHSLWDRITKRPPRPVKSQREPRYIMEFADCLGRLGPTAFKHRYKRSMLIGMGIVAYVAERAPNWSRRTLPMNPYDELAAVQSILDRVWAVRKDPGAKRGPHIVLGNSADNDLVLPDYTVSHHHCAFSFEPGRILFADLDSFNGTLLNGERMEPGVQMPIIDGSTMTIGRIKLQFFGRDSFFERIEQSAKARPASRQRWRF